MAHPRQFGPHKFRNRILVVNEKNSQAMSLFGAHRRLHGRSTKPHARYNPLYEMSAGGEFPETRFTAIPPDVRQKTPLRESDGLPQTRFWGNACFCILNEIRSSSKGKNQ